MTVSSFRSKLLIRNLPANMPEETFLKHLSEWSSHINYVNYQPGHVPTLFSPKAPRASLAYVNFSDADALLSFVDAFLSKFNDSFPKEGGGINTCVRIEFAPYQEIPIEVASVDPLMGTIEDDPEFKTFIQSIETDVTENGQTSSSSLEELIEKMILKERELQPWKYDKAYYMKTPLLEEIKEEFHSIKSSALFEIDRSSGNKELGKKSLLKTSSNSAADDKKTESKEKNKKKKKKNKKKKTETSNVASVPTFKNESSMDPNKSKIESKSANLKIVDKHPPNISLPEIPQTSYKNIVLASSNGETSHISSPSTNNGKTMPIFKILSKPKDSAPKVETITVSKTGSESTSQNKMVPVEEAKGKKPSKKKNSEKKVDSHNNNNNRTEGKGRRIQQSNPSMIDTVAIDGNVTESKSGTVHIKKIYTTKK